MSEFGCGIRWDTSSCEKKKQTHAYKHVHFSLLRTVFNKIVPAHKTNQISLTGSLWTKYNFTCSEDMHVLINAETID